MATASESEDIEEEMAAFRKRLSDTDQLLADVCIDSPESAWGHFGSSIDGSESASPSKDGIPDSPSDVRASSPPDRSESSADCSPLIYMRCNPCDQSCVHLTRRAEPPLHHSVTQGRRVMPAFRIVHTSPWTAGEGWISRVFFCHHCTANPIPPILPHQTTPGLPQRCQYRRAAPQTVWRPQYPPILAPCLALRALSLAQRCSAPQDIEVGHIQSRRQLIPEARKSKIPYMRSIQPRTTECASL